MIAYSQENGSFVDVEIEPHVLGIWVSIYFESCI